MPDGKSPVRLGVLECVRWLPPIAIVLIGAAGLLKAASFDLFAASLQGWQTVPRGWELPIATIVVAGEVSVATAWLVLVENRRRLVIAAALLLAVVTAGYVAESVYAQAPDCLCFGPIRAFERHQASVSGLMWRNGVLLALLVPGMLKSSEDASR